MMNNFGTVLSQKDIQCKMFKANQSENHWYNICQKLGFYSRAELSSFTILGRSTSIRDYFYNSKHVIHIDRICYYQQNILNRRVLNLKWLRLTAEGSEMIIRPSWPADSKMEPTLRTQALFQYLTNHHFSKWSSLRET